MDCSAPTIATPKCSNNCEMNHRKAQSKKNPEDDSDIGRGLMGFFSFESLSSPCQCVILTISLFLFSGLTNIIQEAIISTPNFTYGVMIGYMQMLGVTLCSFIERAYIVKEVPARQAPLRSYTLTSICLLVSSTLANGSLNYINFPTKVIFRSCKLIPTMIIASILDKNKTFSSSEYMSALSICTGLVLFAAADWQLTPSFHPVGIALISVGVFGDAMLTNAQDYIFKHYNTSRLEMTFYSSLNALVMMTVMTLVSGDFLGMVHHIMSHDVKFMLMVVAYTLLFYVVVAIYMNVVKRFGGVSAVLISTGRKGMTLLLSFTMFPKPFSWFYVLGAVLVLGGLSMASIIKHNKRVGIEKDDVVDIMTRNGTDMCRDHDEDPESSTTVATKNGFKSVLEMSVLTNRKRGLGWDLKNCDVSVNNNNASIESEQGNII